MRLSILPLVIALGLLPVAAQAQPIETVRAKIEEARRALNQLEEQERALLAPKVADAEKALSRYVTLSKQGEARATATTPLYIAGGALVADDLTGVGAVDNILLPFVALGLLVGYAATQAPATHSQLDEAWRQVGAALQSAAETAVQVNARRRQQRCSCVCYQKGIGPLPIDPTPDAATCKAACNSQGYEGYRCGKNEVIWN